MNCVCGYYRINDTDVSIPTENINMLRRFNGDEDFIKIMDICVQEESGVKRTGLFACPKCGTVKIRSNHA